MDINSKVILVTGASRGIGAATAKLLAKEGARVVINYKKSRDTAKEVKREIEENGGKAIIVQTDIGWRDAVNKMMKEIIREFGTIDAVVNNAGVVSWKDLIDQTDEEVDNQIDTNLKGMINVTQAVLPIMFKNNDGAIVNIASGAGKTGYAGLSVYCATKFAVLGLTQSLGKELADKGVRVYAVCPGMTATDMTDGSGMPPEKVAKRVVATAKEELGLQPGEETEIYQ